MQQDQDPNAPDVLHTRMGPIPYYAVAMLQDQSQPGIFDFVLLLLEHNTAVKFLYYSTEAWAAPHVEMQVEQEAANYLLQRLGHTRASTDFRSTLRDCYQGVQPRIITVQDGGRSTALYKSCFVTRDGEVLYTDQDETGIYAYNLTNGSARHLFTLED